MCNIGAECRRLEKLGVRGRAPAGKFKDYGMQSVAI